MQFSDYWLIFANITVAVSCISFIVAGYSIISLKRLGWEKENCESSANRSGYDLPVADDVRISSRLHIKVPHNDLSTPVTKLDTILDVINHNGFSAGEKAKWIQKDIMDLASQITLSEDRDNLQNIFMYCLVLSEGTGITDTHTRNAYYWLKKAAISKSRTFNADMDYHLYEDSMNVSIGRAMRYQFDALHDFNNARLHKKHRKASHSSITKRVPLHENKAKTSHEEPARDVAGIR